MSYPLHFFDELVGNTISPIYTIIPLDIITKKDLTGDIEKEGRKVLRILRSEYYSSSNNPERAVYFEKILKRLLKLKSDLEYLIREMQDTYLTSGRLVNKVFPELENKYELYNNIHSFICVILLEFNYKVEGVDVDSAVKYDINLHDKQKLREDFEKMARSVRETGHYDPSIMEAYGIEEGEEFVHICEHAFIKEEIEELREQNSLFDPTFEFNVSSFIKKYTSKYVDIRDKSKLNLFHGYALKFLLKKLKEINNEQEKLDLILDFFLNTSLASELFLEFLKKQLDIISVSEDHGNIIKEFNAFENRLSLIKEKPQFQLYHASRVMEVEKSSLDLAYELLREYKIRLGLDIEDIANQENFVQTSDSSTAEPKQVQLLEANGKKFLSEKIQYNGTASSLGLLFALFFESGLIKSKHVKSQVARVLSVSFNAQGGAFMSDTILKAINNPDKDKKSVKYIEQMFKNMKIKFEDLKAK